MHCYICDFSSGVTPSKYLSDTRIFNNKVLFDKKTGRFICKECASRIQQDIREERLKKLLKDGAGQNTVSHLYEEFEVAEIDPAADTPSLSKSKLPVD